MGKDFFLIQTRRGRGGGGGKRGRYSSLIIAKFPNIKLRFWGLVKFISVSAGIAHLLEIVIQQ